MFNSTTVASNDDEKGPETRVWPPYASLPRLADGKAVHQHTQCDHCLPNTHMFVSLLLYDAAIQLPLFNSLHASYLFDIYLPTDLRLWTVT